MCFVHQQKISEQFLVEFSLLSGHCAFGGYWIGIFERVLCHRFGIQQILEPVNALLILKEGVRWLSVHAEDLADSRLVFFLQIFFTNMTSNKKYVKSTLSVVCYIFFCLWFLVVHLYTKLQSDQLRCKYFPWFPSVLILFCYLLERVDVNFHPKV